MKYRIWIEHHVQGLFAPSDDWVRDHHDNKPLEFPSRKEAEEMVKHFEAKRVALWHGEYARPTYRVCSPLDADRRMWT